MSSYSYSYHILIFQILPICNSFNYYAIFIGDLYSKPLKKANLSLFTSALKPLLMRISKLKHSSHWLYLRDKQVVFFCLIHQKNSETIILFFFILYSEGNFLCFFLHFSHFVNLWPNSCHPCKKVIPARLSRFDVEKITHSLQLIVGSIN